IAGAAAKLAAALRNLRHAEQQERVIAARIPSGTPDAELHAAWTITAAARAGVNAVRREIHETRLRRGLYPADPAIAERATRRIEAERAERKRPQAKAT